MQHAEDIIAGTYFVDGKPRREVNYPFTRISVLIISAFGSKWIDDGNVIVCVCWLLIATVNCAAKIIAMNRNDE